MKRIDLYDIEKIEENKFSIDYFIETRGVIRLNEAIEVLHNFRITKNIENIMQVDKINRELEKIVFDYLGLLEDYFKVIVIKDIDNDKISDFKNYGIKKIMSIIIYQGNKDELIKETDLLVIEKLKNKVIKHQNLINYETFEQIKCLYKLLPINFKNQFIEEIKKTKIKPLLEGLLLITWYR